ncbi:hypothetical protein [Williamsia sp. CHRR-6]|uniref:hypothetical protein n=1 Tax=Williamsia sp. CHRR-6 TaxID=2835871 RepID=UPI001BD9CC5E|nr:hypothetical protein [Williamsia sp. CHRR-6]MBT0566267.1 hypothetical protein [Williamsia sp. CHRR-6]
MSNPGVERLFAEKLAKIHEAAARLESTVRQVNNMEFPPIVDHSNGDPRRTPEYQQELKRRLEIALNEWHEDNGWTAELPADERSELISRIESDLHRRSG